LLNGLKLSQISHDDYALDWQQLQKCRAEYIRSIAQLPPYRMNFYITGGSGTGKSLSSRALAKTLIDPENMLKDEEVFFTVGQGASMFAGYDGQPVIIWDDLRAMDLLKQFNNNPGAVFNLFDVIPSAANQNIKFGSVKLINTINIVNSVQKFDEFVDQICFKNAKSEMAEPDKQMYRRFPFFVELSANQKYDFFVNKQFFNEDEPNYKAYLQHKNLGIGLLKIDKAYKKEPKIKQQLTNKHFEKVDEEHKKAVKKFDDVAIDDVLILQQQLNLELDEIDKNVIEVVDYEIAEKDDDSDNKLPQNYGQSGYPKRNAF
jgi:ABC-type dipeptide/oligopeptide/nickel transport system ATPase component